MKILILGFPGYIARVIFEELKTSNQVIVLGRSSPHSPPIFFKSDLKNMDELSSILSSFQPDWVIDTVGEKDLYKKTNLEIKNLELIIHQNILLSLSKVSPKSKYLFFSSRQEYGIPNHLPVNEDHPILPISTYGEKKAQISEMIKNLATNLSLQSTVLRLSNVYGWSDHPLPSQIFSSSAINSMIISAHQGINLKVYKPGNQMRDYLYLTDLTSLIKKILLASPLPLFSIFNIGSGKGLSIYQMANNIAHYHNVKVELKSWPQNIKQVETGSYISDISKAKKAFLWEPTINFEQGLTLFSQKLNKLQSSIQY